MLEGHVAFGNPAVGNVPQDAAHRVQADPRGQHPAQVFPLLQVGQDLAEKPLRILLPDVGNDPGGVDDAVDGAQAVQGPLKIGPHRLSVRVKGSSVFRRAGPAGRLR